MTLTTNRSKFLLVLVGLLTLPSLSQTVSGASSAQQTGILWQIEKQGIKPSYLLGTVHSDDSRIVNIPRPVLLKLRAADSFAAELKMDRFTAHETRRLMLLPHGQTLESIIGAARYKSCVRLLERYGIPESSVQQMKPWAVIVTLSMPQGRGGEVLDQRLYREAEILGKQVFGLETGKEQVATLESFSLPEQLEILDDAIRDVDRLPAMFDEIVHYYLKRDLAGLERISEKYMLQGNRAIARQFRNRILIDRNYRMLRRMKPRLMQGNSFIAVGALHLPGEEGLLRLLEKEGYKVSAVY